MADEGELTELLPLSRKFPGKRMIFRAPRSEQPFDAVSLFVVACVAMIVVVGSLRALI